MLLPWAITPSTRQGIARRVSGPPVSAVSSAAAPTSATQSCGFYNVIEITDPAGDASPGAPSYVDVLKLTVRQFGQYVQFVWETNGNPYNNDHHYYFLIFDTDLNPNTGQRWDGAGGELMIGFYHTASLSYFDAAGNVTREDHGLPLIFEGNRFYLNVEKSKIPGDHFNLYFESSGETAYYDRGSLHEIWLQPAQAPVKLVIEADTMVLPENPPLIKIPDKSTPVQLRAYRVQDGTKILLPASEVAYSVYHPVQHDPRLGDPSSIISIDANGVAHYLREGYVFMTAYSKTCHLQSERVILATGESYGNPDTDNVIAVFPPNYAPPGSPYTFGHMMRTYPNYMRTVNLAYEVTRDLYRGFVPFNGEKQILALLVMEGHCGGNNNPLEVAPCCYMNCGTGTPQYNVVIHEMGHNFGGTKGMMQLTGANHGRIGGAGFGECVASLPVIYFARGIYEHPERYGIDRNSFEWQYYTSFMEADVPYARLQLENFEALIRSGQTMGVFDNNGLFDGVAVFCSFFQSYAYGFTQDTNLFGNEMIRRFLNIFDNRSLPDFREDKVETYFAAAFSVAVGQDVRDKLRFWGFHIDDAYYEHIHKLISVPFYDFDGNGSIDTQDVQRIANAWRSGNLRFDVEGDGDVDVVDVMRVAAHWGERFYWQPQWQFPGERLYIDRRWSMAMAYDPHRRVVVMFGGRDPVGNPLNDTWEYDGTTWTRVTTAHTPPARYLHGMVYDTRRQVMVLFGGERADTRFDDTWEYDGTDWRRVYTSHSPSARQGFAMTYDACRQRVVLFGGNSQSGLQGDTWEYDGTDWVRIETTTSPPVRTLTSMVHDPTRCRIILFGGLPAGPLIALNDTWEYDGTTWTQVNTPASPIGRWAHAMAYDAARHRVVLFGGYGPVYPQGSQLGDTWEYDGNTWVQVFSDVSPTPREQHAMAYDLVRQRVVLFGGFRNPGGFGGDTWEYGVLAR